MTDKPMNPWADKDFTNAIKDATDYFGDKLKEMEDAFPFLKFDDLKEEYCGIMRFKISDMWERITDYLTDAGYEVTIRKEDATETERQLDGIEKWVVIEYGEVE